jgi:signal transduction histidine kinase
VVHPHPIELELGELLAAPLESSKLAAQAKGLAVQTAYAGDVLLQVDRELASSAVANVLDNAVKYTDSGEIRVVADIETDRVTLHVWDNCPGLSEAELQVVFEPFERGHSTKPGSGLGLAIARRALEAQGGAIGAESKGERGCHFWISLPRAPH